VTALQNDPNPLAPGAPSTLRILAQDRHLAAAALAIALEDLDRRRLAGAVGAEEREHLACVDVQVDPPDGLDVPVGLAEALDLDHRCHAVEATRPHDGT
jgi:hypothetical protein